MGSTRLEFLPAMPASPTTIKFSYTATMSMAAGESLMLTLPFLYGASRYPDPSPLTPNPSPMTSCPHHSSPITPDPSPPSPLTPHPSPLTPNP